MAITVNERAVSAEAFGRNAKRQRLLTPSLIRDTRVALDRWVLGNAARDKIDVRSSNLGAEHFMYVIRGRGTAYANGRPIAVRSGDLIYYGDRERHCLRSEADVEMAFIEFFVPGVYRTVRAPGAAICTWLPTGRDIRGGKPAREIKAHTSAEVESPQDV